MLVSTGKRISNVQQQVRVRDTQRRYGRDWRAGRRAVRGRVAVQATNAQAALRARRPAASERAAMCTPVGSADAAELPQAAPTGSAGAVRRCGAVPVALQVVACYNALCNRQPGGAFLLSQCCAEALAVPARQGRAWACRRS